MPAPSDSLPNGPPELADHPKFRIVRKLGSGGMGTVYLAEHQITKRRVALKVINRAVLTHRNAVQRFLAEAQAASQLTHPNIVSVLDADCAGTLHFLVMEYVEGINLADYQKENGPLPVDLACRLVVQAAAGLQHAHEKGLVHRDIKPANLMLTPSGQVKILDFGLVRVMENSGKLGLTRLGACMGTAEYMAPEQSRDASKADSRADIYSLGCTLYCLLTGEPPFVGPTAMVVRELHEPDFVHQRRPEVSEELSLVVARMLGKQAEDRFPTAVEAARALAPFCRKAPPPLPLPPVAGTAGGSATEPGSSPPGKAASVEEQEPTASPRVGVIEGVRRWCRRNPIPATVCCLGIVALLVVLFLRSRGPEKASSGSTALIWSTPPGNTWWWCAAFSPRGDSLAAGEDPRPNPDPNTIRIRVWPFKKGLPDSDSFVIPHQDGGRPVWLTGMTFSGDGARLASAAQTGSICLWDMAALPPTLLTRVPGVEGIVTGLAFSPDGRYLAAGARREGGRVLVWDLSDLGNLRRIYDFKPKEDDEISALVFSRDSQTLFIGTGKKKGNGKVFALKYHTPDPAAVLWSSPVGIDQTWVRTLDITRDGTILGLTYGDKAYLINPQTGATQLTLKGHVPGHAVQWIAFTPDGKRCVTAGYDKTMRVWLVADGKQLWQNDVLTGMNEGLSLSPDGRLAFTTCHWIQNPAGNVAQLWRLPAAGR
jgi:serine/threonine protein kinase/WD40 repeat protein